MSARQQSSVLLFRNEIVAPPAPRACDDHTFEFPTGIYVAMATLLFGFLSVMAVGFADPGLVVPMAVSFVFLTAFFGVPVVFVTGSPKDVGPRALRWSEFMREGVDTATGRISGREAVVLTLVLPFLIFCWAVAIVAIAALI